MRRLMLLLIFIVALIVSVLAFTPLGFVLAQSGDWRARRGVGKGRWHTDERAH